MAKDKRERFYKWTVVIYPGDSAPENYESIIKNWHIPCCLSPIHDQDVNGDETEKKKHQHLFIDFSPVKKSFDEVKEFTSILCGTIPQRVLNEKGLIRYFVHYDNPEKAQYSITDIKAFSGYEFTEFFNNSSDEDRLYTFIEQIIIDNRIYNIIDLVQYLSTQQQYDLLTFVRRHTYYTNAFLNGMYQKLNRSEFDKSNHDI